jgi:C4-type Zn-finger protein
MSVMKPSCPKCGSIMTVAAKSRKDVPIERTTYSCEPCCYVFSEVAPSSTIVERAMLLDLQANEHFGAMH